MSTAMNKAGPTPDSFSNEMDHVRAVHEAFSKLGCDLRYSQARPAPAAAVPVRGPCSQAVIIPVPRQRVEISPDDCCDTPTWTDRVGNFMYFGCLALAALMFVKAIPAPWRDSLTGSGIALT